MATVQAHPVPKQTGLSSPWSAAPVKRRLTCQEQVPRAATGRGVPGWMEEAGLCSAGHGRHGRLSSQDPAAAPSQGRWLPSERAGLGRCLGLPHCLKKRLPPFGQPNWPLGTGGPADGRTDGRDTPQPREPSAPSLRRVPRAQDTARVPPPSCQRWEGRERACAQPAPLAPPAPRPRPVRPPARPRPPPRLRPAGRRR